MGKQCILKESVFLNRAKTRANTVNYVCLFSTFVETGMSGEDFQHR